MHVKRHNAAVDAMEKVAASFNEQIRSYKARATDARATPLSINARHTGLRRRPAARADGARRRRRALSGDATDKEPDHAQPARVVITGAARPDWLPARFQDCLRQMLGTNQPVILQLLEIPPALGALNGVVMELEDCAFPTLHGVVATDQAEVAFADADYALLVGAKPRGPGMERSDLLKGNAQIFSAQGKAMNEKPHATLKVLVVGNPANTNALIAQQNAPDLNPANFTAMTRLDHNRAMAQLAEKTGQHVNDIGELTIWGNHSATQYPDVSHAKVGDKPAEDLVDETWLVDDFIPTVQQRGAAIIKARGASSAASAASAAIDHVRDWALGTPGDEWVSMAVPADGSYASSRRDLLLPCRCSGGRYEIVQDLDISEFSRRAWTRPRPSCARSARPSPICCELTHRGRHAVAGRTQALATTPGLPGQSVILSCPRRHRRRRPARLSRERFCSLVSLAARPRGRRPHPGLPPHRPALRDHRDGFRDAGLCPVRHRLVAVESSALGRLCRPRRAQFRRFRRHRVTAPLLRMYRTMMPSLSDTEREALEAGTVLVGRRAVYRHADWSKLTSMPAPRLSAEEQAFLDGPTEELCRMLDEWQVTHELADMPPEVWACIKDQRFFAMIIPKEYGGWSFRRSRSPWCCRKSRHVPRTVPARPWRAQLARPGRAAVALRHGGAEAALPAGAGQRRRDPVLRADLAARRL